MIFLVSINSGQLKQFLLWAFGSLFSSLLIQLHSINICEKSLLVILHARCWQNKDKWGTVTMVKEVTRYHSRWWSSTTEYRKGLQSVVPHYPQNFEDRTHQGGDFGVYIRCHLQKEFQSFFFFFSSLPGAIKKVLNPLNSEY